VLRQRLSWLRLQLQRMSQHEPGILSVQPCCSALPWKSIFTFRPLGEGRILTWATNAFYFPTLLTFSGSYHQINAHTALRYPRNAAFFGVSSESRGEKNNKQGTTPGDRDCEKADPGCCPHTQGRRTLWVRTFSSEPLAALCPELPSARQSCGESARRGPDPLSRPAPNARSAPPPAPTAAFPSGSGVPSRRPSASLSASRGRRRRSSPGPTSAVGRSTAVADRRGRRLRGDAAALTSSGTEGGHGCRRSGRRDGREREDATPLRPRGTGGGPAARAARRGRAWAGPDVSALPRAPLWRVSEGAGRSCSPPLGAACLAPQRDGRAREQRGAGGGSGKAR